MAFIGFSKLLDKYPSYDMDDNFSNETNNDYLEFLRLKLSHPLDSAILIMVK